jgi:hypothetical protein
MAVGKTSRYVRKTPSEKNLIRENYMISVTKRGIFPLAADGYSIHANNGACYKIYVIKARSKVLYVGMAKQKMRTRFAGSFRAFTKKNETGKSAYGGYSGHKWIKEFLASGKCMELSVFAFPGRASEEDRKFIEAVEAEIVFKVRAVTGKWPLAQHEIHFHNMPQAGKLANQIYQQIK